MQTTKTKMSPIAGIQSKNALLTQILPNFPSNINTFVDLFCGSGNVALNTPAKNHILNDIDPIYKSLFEYIRDNTVEDIMGRVTEIDEKYNIREHRENFQQLIDAYNDNRDPLYYLVCIRYANGNDVAHRVDFSIKGKVKSAKVIGLGRVKSQIQQLKKFLNLSNCEFSALDYLDFDTSKLTSRDLIYIDPPSIGMTDKKRHILYSFLDGLHEKGIRFAYSGKTMFKNKLNTDWMAWGTKYNVILLTEGFSSGCFSRYRECCSVDALIVNYKI